MSCTAGTCTPRISGVAAMAGIDVNQPKVKASTTGSSGRSCATEHRRLAGGRIGLNTGGPRASQKAQQGASRAQIRVKWCQKPL
jgi:hypothetical protein